MSGVFGIVDPRRRIDCDALAQQMAASLAHYPWHVTEWHSDAAINAAVGRVGIGPFNGQAQPAWSADHSVAAFLAGEFYSVEGQSTLPTVAPCEQLLLQLYTRHGQDFARYLDGAFICAVWDLTRRRLVIANDRFGLYPVYLSRQNNRFVFAPEMKAILQDSGFRRRCDLTALAQYVRFQQVLGERTFFEDIQLLPPGSVLVCDLETARCAVNTYWSYSAIPFRPEVSFDEAVVETGRLLRNAVRRLSGDDYRSGVYLSGGLDSRTILGLMARQQVPSINYGQRFARDVDYAAQIAAATGSSHHWFDLPDGHWVCAHVDQHLTLTEGFHSWIHSHGMSVLEPTRSLMDVMLTGWDGGTVLGDDDTIEPLQLQAVDDRALTVRLFERFNQKYTWPGVTEAEERLLYTETLWPQVRGLAFDSFREELQPYLSLRPDVRSGYFYIRHHCGRLTHNMVTMYRSHFEVRFPFFDYALFDFLYSLPASLRGHKVLYRAVLQREAPHLARIPYDHDEFLPTSRGKLRQMHALSVKVRRRLSRWFPSLARPKATLYADYEAYLRNELRPWAEDLLFDPRTAGRGLFDPRFLQTLMARQASGLEQWIIGKIAPVMTYEMLLRRFLD